MKRRRLFILAVFAVILIFGFAGSSSATWISKGPIGTYAGTLFCSPTNPNSVFAGTSGGIYNTTDLGTSWAYKGLRFKSVDAIAARTGCGLGLMAAGGDDLFNSMDGGNTWGLVVENIGDIEALAVTQSPDCIVFVGTEDGVYGSNYSYGLSGIGITALAVDSSNSVYAATEEDGVYKTTNDGFTWTQSGLTVFNVTDLRIDSADRIFAGTIGGGVFLSTDGGENWAPKNNGLPSISGYPDVHVVFSLEKDGAGNLYAGVITGSLPFYSGGVYKSANNGDTWSPTNTQINNYSAESMCATLNNGLFVGTNKGIYRTDDFGANWVDLTDKISAFEFTNSFVRDSEGTLFIGTGESGGVYKSSDGGENWVKSGDDNSIVDDLLIDDSGKMYRTSWYGVFTSTDEGQTWVLSSNGLPTYNEYGLSFYYEADSLAIDGSGRIYVGLETGEVYYTDDQAANWSATSPLPFTDEPEDINALLGDPYDDTIYAGTGGDGVFKSIDGGSTWEQKNNGLPTDAAIEENAFFLDTTTGDIYAGVNSGLYRSPDGGDSWENIEMPLSYCEANAVTMDRYNNLYTILCSGSSYVSSDRGSTWIDISNGLKSSIWYEGVHVNGIFAVNNNLYLATKSGIYKSIVPALCGISFLDVPLGYWAEDYIKLLYCINVTSGCSTFPLLYCPESVVTRAQMAVFIIKSMVAAGLLPPDFTYPANPYFSDVPTNHWAFKYIQKMKELNITGGCGGGNYCPDSNVTRAQMAVFIEKALGVTIAPVCTGTVFNDVNAATVGSAFCGYIEDFAARKITGGCGGGSYCPFNDVTRAQMAVFLIKAF